jgi:hypothetical protein
MAAKRIRAKSAVKPVKPVADVEPVKPRRATIITVTPGDVGNVVASNGVLTQIRVPQMPDASAPDSAFTLTDIGGPGVARQLYSIDSLGMGILVGEKICRPLGGLRGEPTLSTYPIEFKQLMVAAVPRGAVVELEVA